MSTEYTINGQNPRAWLQSAVQDLLVDHGKPLHEVIERYLEPSFFRQTIVSRRAGVFVSREELKDHCESLRGLSRELLPEFDFSYVVYDGTHLGWNATLSGLNADGTDYVSEVLVTAEVRDNRLAWAKETLWYTKGDRSPWDRESQRAAA